MPPGGHIFNVRADRYRFTVGLCAALVAGKISLLPSTHTPEMVRQLASFAPDAFCLHDTPDCDIALPRFRVPGFVGQAGAATLPEPSIPSIPGERVMAYVFTSGSTGQPVPHRKTWGFLVSNARAAAARLGLQDGRAYTLVGTVPPPAHVWFRARRYLLALQGGIALSAAHNFYPADIRDALDTVPRPRVLVTSPVHLRALLRSPARLPPADAYPVCHRATVGEAGMRGGGTPGGAADGNLRQHRNGPTGYAPHRADQRLGTVPWGEAGSAAASRRRNRWKRRRGPATRSGQRAAMWNNPSPWATRWSCWTKPASCCTAARRTWINIAGKRTSLAYLNHQLNAIEGVEDGVFFMPDAPPGERAEGQVRRTCLR
ncbi:hypothetical protein ACU4GD_10860 [Cupriavidus basilensis]